MANSGAQISLGSLSGVVQDRLPIHQHLADSDVVCGPAQCQGVHGTIAGIIDDPARFDVLGRDLLLPFQRL